MFALLVKLNETSHVVISASAVVLPSAFLPHPLPFLSDVCASGYVRAALQQLHRVVVREALCSGPFLQHPCPQVRSTAFSSSLHFHISSSFPLFPCSELCLFHLHFCAEHTSPPPQRPRYRRQRAPRPSLKCLFSLRPFPE